SLSPVLMERYLAAADSIVRRAILVDPPRPPVRRQSARYLEPATREASSWRPIDRGGMLHTPFRLSLPGTYHLRVRAYGESPDAQAPRIALVLDGKEVKTFDVTATKQRPGVYEANLTLESASVRAG